MSVKKPEDKISKLDAVQQQRSRTRKCTLSCPPTPDTVSGTRCTTVGLIFHRHWPQLSGIVSCDALRVRVPGIALYLITTVAPADSVPRSFVRSVVGHTDSARCGRCSAVTSEPKEVINNERAPII
ncbi:hypothetical protein BaRGS_00003023 [Batillaria attramentaria]|uniref:Uncharacterized protein n=1 Tax=Batillaria attramentaria TaxID=370345 RepID=A0ABD0M3I7_9CAEN